MIHRETEISRPERFVEGLRELRAVLDDLEARCEHDAFLRTLVARDLLEKAEYLKRLLVYAGRPSSAE